LEIKIGIAESPRELVVLSDQTLDEIQQLIGESLASGDGLLKLVDENGRRFTVPVAQIAYVELAPGEASPRFSLG
jgi:hypothetical protein